MTDCPPWIVFLGPPRAVETAVETRAVWVEPGKCAEPVGMIELMRQRYPHEAVLAVMPAPRPPRERRE